MPLARAISFGRMDSDGGVVMVAVSLAALSLAVIGQTAFMIVTYACYARKDTRTPLMSMLVQTTICLGLASTALLLEGPAMLMVLGLAFSLSVAAAAYHLTAQVWRNLSPAGTQRLAPSLARFVAGAALMAGPAWLVADTVPHWLGRSLGPRVGIAAAVLVGGAVFLALQALWRAPELGWLAGGLIGWHHKDNRVMAEVVNG
jgi:putative peptidoglycan lipid II flippase